MSNPVAIASPTSEPKFGV